MASQQLNRFVVLSPVGVRMGLLSLLWDPFKLRYHYCSLILRHCDCSGNESFSRNSIFSNTTEESSSPNNWPIVPRIIFSKKHEAVHSPCQTEQEGNTFFVKYQIGLISFSPK